MIEAPLFSPSGARKSAGYPLPAPYFDGTVHPAAMHQAVKVHLANRRQGTHATKTRGLVSGGNQKPWRQKGTGRARQGSIRSPLWPGGGTVFGPMPRDYSLKLPRKLKHLARRSALNARASEGNLYVIERFEQQSPRTRELVALLDAMGVAGRKVLILTHGVSEAVYLSGRNVPRVRVLPYLEASTYDILWSDVVVVEEPALRGELPVPAVRPMVPAPRPVPGERPARPGRPAREAAPEPKTPAKAKTKKAGKPAAEKPAKAAPKKAAKKPAARPGRPGGKKKGGR